VAVTVRAAAKLTVQVRPVNEVQFVHVTDR
jgi:hypothetical protein